MTTLGQTSGLKRVVIVDDHPVVRQGVQRLVDQESDLAVCGEANDRVSALQCIERERPDAVVVDLSLKESSGLDLIKDIQVRWPEIRVLVLTMHGESFYVERALRIGARGYVSKSEPPLRVIEGLRRILSGEMFVNEKAAAKVLRDFASGATLSGDLPVERLSNREFEVFEMIGEGLKKGQIAERLHLSAKTVGAHQEHIKKKLNLSTAAQLSSYAMRWNQFEAHA